MKPKIITPTTFTNAAKLSAFELNRIHFGDKHTVLTPERLKRLSDSSSNR